MDDNVINSYVKHGVKMALLRFAWLIAVLCPFVGQAQTTVEYIHTDALGSPVAVTNASGNVIEREVYEPYGSPITRPPSDQPGFTGHVADSLTGLTYMQQRYYDPQIGRFLSVDPVTAYSNPVGAFNRYWYANNNPYKFTDPDGRQSRENAQVASTGSPLFDWILSPSDARSSHSQMVKEQLTAELSQPHSAKDIALYIAVAASLGTGAAGGTLRAEGVAGAARGVMARSGTRGASGTLITKGGNRYHGNSTGSSISGGNARSPMNPLTQQALDSVQNPSRTHGACCEIDAVNKALNAGDDVRGATMGPVKLNESDRVVPACSTCREVKKTLGVN
ncbi:RHS repeat-associated core domain-containing protein [Stenotrophomonas sp. MH1]|uniref:RHS repeat-associated core domain-containing protein n=1 Tax=Stenotrophomonas capsici TaxID=3110230 RepID=A0ABU5V6B7_9GAMM|nr:RHS repeat-associated core domain-containing protein [Stenotrophomonas sp. MH1]MEA5668060.1 RHS repeat-associated core domain-containing protein [Stenotrophomonas sp. MH1]